MHIIVKGRVQGVGFRAATQRQAVKLNLTGFVRNLANGDVEIVARGPDAALQQLLAWCHQGPRLAHVSHIGVGRCDNDEAFADFTIR